MKVQQVSLVESNWKDKLTSINLEANLFLLFVSPEFKFKQDVLITLKNNFPDTIIMGCSTAGEISDITVKDASISLTAIKFDKVDLKKVLVTVKNMECSKEAGKQITAQLKSKNLKHILVLSDGLHVNGADLVKGLRHKNHHVSITGGLAADGSDFNETFIINDGEIVDKAIIALGLYGENLKVGFSSKGGWDSFGIERHVTKSLKNVLYELDGFPALELYKSFLGEAALDLPSSGLLFPLSLRVDKNTIPVVRTILAVNEEEQSLTFAGNIPQGAYVRLMNANIDKLIKGAEDSAHIANREFKNTSELAILISCVGRRLVLKQMVEEEIEVVRDVLGNKPCITGFYSYGEMAPFGKFLPCELHNQTMTITTLSEC